MKQAGCAADTDTFTYTIFLSAVDYLAAFDTYSAT